jgi:hypothetical protein
MLYYDGELSFNAVNRLYKRKTWGRSVNQNFFPTSDKVIFTNNPDLKDIPHLNIGLRIMKD